MNDLESRVAERLRARESSAPPPSLHLAVAIGAAVERRRHRRRIWASAGVSLVAAVAATVVVVPAVFSGNGQPKPADPAASTIAPPSVAARSSHAALPERLARLFPGVDALVVDRRLADGSDFRGLSVSDDGIVAGINQSYDKDFVDRWDRAVLLDLANQRYTTYGDVNPDLLRAGTSPAADGSTLSWSTGSPDRCRDLASGRSEQRGMGAILDQGHLVWNRGTGPEGVDSTTTVMVATGCGPGEPLAAKGELVAVGWPWVYLSDGRGDYFRVNADSGRGEPVPRPTDVPADASRSADTFGIAAHGDVVAWQLDGRLAVCEPPATICGGLSVPAVNGANGTSTSLSVGDRFVAYGTSGIDGDPSKSKGVVYDTTTHEFITLPGEAMTAGPWMLWLEDDGYHVLDTRAGG